MKEYRVRDLEQDALDAAHAVIFGNWPDVHKAFARAETPMEGAFLALGVVDALERQQLQPGRRGRRVPSVPEGGGDMTKPQLTLREVQVLLKMERARLAGQLELADERDIRKHEDALAKLLQIEVYLEERRECPSRRS